jgi:hypothetical protein
MSEKFKSWAKNLGDDIKRDVAEFATSEANRAREDIRQKVVQEGWTGSHSPYEAQGTPWGKTEGDTVISEADTGPYITDAEFEDIKEFEGTVWHQEGQQLTDGTQRDIERTDIEVPQIEAPEIQEPDIDELEIEPE